MSESERYISCSGTKLIAKLPSRVTKVEIIEGRLFADTISHGRFEVTEDGALIPIASAATSKGIH